MTLFVNPAFRFVVQSEALICSLQVRVEDDFNVSGRG